MKRALLSLSGIGSSLLLGLCAALYFQQMQKDAFNKTNENYVFLQRNLKTLEKDLDFLKKHHKKLNFLIKKGWFTPQSRLIGGEKITQCVGPLNKIRFTFEPETIKEETEGYSFKVSKIVIEADSPLDEYIYDFSINILKKFSGILIFRKLSVSRNEPVNETTLSALRQHKRSNFVLGEITYEWFVIRDQNHEE